MIRRDLATVEQLAAEVADGAPPAHVQETIGSLQTNGPLWQLRVNCLAYCRFVHSHHGAEDVLLFPALRRSAPELGPVVDRLEADHRVVSDQLDEVEDAARALVEDDGPAARARVSAALAALAGHLLEHLEFEEEAISPTLRTWTAWPAG